MIKRLDNVKLKITLPESELLKIAKKHLGAPVKYFKILKKSLDARDKSNIFWLYSIAFSATAEVEQERKFDRIKTDPKVIIVGSGPAGLMCALRLIDHGFAPIIIERGQAVEERKATCEKFFNDRVLNEQSNVQFGEGGAGAFSDGKLNTQTKDSLNRDVLKYFHKFGAAEEILYLNKPHVGSDVLYTVLQNIRKYIIDNGGKFLFNTRVTDIVKSGNALSGVVTENITHAQSQIDCGAAVFAIGHSARDTFEMLSARGTLMEARDFAIGVRIEHLADEISRAQYGKSYVNLPTADYKLVSHAHERTVFTFCMCPGGVVMPAASQAGGVVVNGMSNYKRDGTNSNSALMVQMKREDFGSSDDLFAGMRFQREIEQKAYVYGGSDYRAPVQLYGDFARDKISQRFGEVQPTYAAGTTFAPLNEVLPKVTQEALKAAIPDMDRRLKGFANPEAVLTGVETRFSSPVKILRGEDLQSVTIKNLYPCGEGSGYSGGITSSAADGLKVAEYLFNKFI